jgi:hypothetical protein
VWDGASGSEGQEKGMASEIEGKERESDIDFGCATDTVGVNASGAPYGPGSA